MAKEIERKFLVADEVLLTLKDILAVDAVEQIYLYGDGKTEIRFRKSTDMMTQTTSYTMTIKVGSGLERKEYEHPITQEAYEELSRDKRKLKKVRFTLSLKDGRIGYLDRYLLVGGSLKPNILEVEFESKEEAESFVPPHWVREEVTDDPSYQAYHLYNQKGGY